MTTDLFQSAQQALHERNYPLAQQQLLTLVNANPSHGEAWWQLAQTFDDPQKRQDCLDRAARHGYVPAIQQAEPEPAVLAGEQAAMPAENPQYAAPVGAFQLPAAPPNPTLEPADLSQIVKILKSKTDRQQQIQSVMSKFDCSAEHADMLLQGVAYHYPQLLRPSQINSKRLVLEIASMIFGIVLAVIGGFLLFNPIGPMRRKWPLRLGLAGIIITCTAGYRLFMLTRNPS